MKIYTFCSFLQDLTSNEHNTLLGANEWYSENFTVIPETYYTVEVFARCGDNFTGSKTNVLLQAPTGSKSVMNV